MTNRGCNGRAIIVPTRTSSSAEAVDDWKEERGKTAKPSVISLILKAD
jgi:hypothetical protein